MNKGIWFFGFPGSGKTYASRYLKKKIVNAFLIDGDFVRKFISTDLGYKIKDRKIQTKRLLGLAKLTLKNDLFPIITSSYLGRQVGTQAQKLGIKVIFVKRDRSLLKKKILKKKNVFGKDIKIEKFKFIIYENDIFYKKKLDKLIKNLKNN
jgi:adenylylsulfate kinase-like enzyme